MVKWYFPSIVIDLFEFEGRENKYQNKCPSAWDFFIIKCIIKMYKWIYSRKNHKKLPTSDIKERKRGKLTKNWQKMNWILPPSKLMNSGLPNDVRLARAKRENELKDILADTSSFKVFYVTTTQLKIQFDFFNFRIRCFYQMSSKVNYRNLENLLLLNLKLRKYYLDRPNIFIKNIGIIGKVSILSNHER